MIKCIIFDFNGTLFFDHDLNYRAWKQVFSQITEDKFSFEEEYEKYKSSGNYVFIKNILALCEKECNDEIIDYWSTKKEKIYQKIGIDENRTNLAPGAEKFLNWLIQKNISINLASCSVPMNVDFYYHYFGIEKWFNRKMIVCDGTTSNKGEMFLMASNNMGYKIEDCMIIEDSISSIQDALRVGCRHILYVNSRNIPCTHKEIIQTIHNYNEINYQLIESLFEE